MLYLDEGENHQRLGKQLMYTSVTHIMQVRVWSWDQKVLVQGPSGDDQWEGVQLGDRGICIQYT